MPAASNRRKLDAVAERVDALRADTDKVAEMENRLRAFAARASVRFADDGMVEVAINASLGRKFFEAIHADEAFHENLHQLDEESEFLHRNNQRIILFAEMAFHELRGLPFHQLALG